MTPSWCAIRSPTEDAKRAGDKSRPLILSPRRDQFGVEGADPVLGAGVGVMPGSLGGVVVVVDGLVIVSGVDVESGLDIVESGDDMVELGVVVVEPRRLFLAFWLVDGIDCIVSID